MRWIRSVAVAALVLGLTAAALLIALSHGFQREALRAALEAELQRSLALPVRIEILEGPLVPALRLRGLRAGPAELPLLVIERLDIRFDAWALLRERRLVFEAIELEGAQFAFSRSADGVWHGPGLDLGDDGGASVSRLEIHSLALERSRIALRWEQAGVARELVGRVELSGAQLAVPWTAADARLARAHLHVAFEPTALLDGQLERAELELELGDARLAIVRAELESSAGRLRLEGGAEIAGWIDRRAPAAADLAVAFEDLDLAALSGRPALAGVLAGRAELGVRLGAEQPVSEAELRLALGVDRSTLSALRELRVLGTYQAGTWSLDTCEIAGEGVAVSADGRGSSAAIERLRVRARISQLERFAFLGDAADLRGDADLDAELAGPFERPEGRVSLTAEHLSVRQLELGTLRAELASAGEGRVRLESLSLQGGALPLQLTAPAGLRLEDGGVVFEDLRLSAGSQRLAFDGRVEPGGLRDARLEARAIDVGSWAVLLAAPVALGGRADLDLRLDGPFERPRARGSLTWVQPQIAEFRFEQLAAQLESSEHSLQLRAQVRDAGGELARADAWLPYGAALDRETLLATPETRLELHAEAFELALLAPFLPAQLEQLQGRARVDLELHGGDPPSARGTLELDDGRLRLAALDHLFAPLRIHLGLEPDPSGIRIAALELESQGQTLSATGVVSASELRDVRVALRGFDTALAAPLVAMPGAFAGVVDVELEATGAFSAPRLSGTARWRTPRIADFPLEEISAEFALEEAVLRASARIREAGNEVLRLDSSAPAASISTLASLLADPRSSLEIRGDAVELSILQPFLPRQIRELSGRADLAIELRGRTPNPLLRGSLSLVDGSLRIPLLRQTFAPLAGRLELEDGALIVAGLEIGPPEGGARLTGRVELDALAPIDLALRLELHGLALSRNPALRTDVNGDVRISGPPDGLMLQGELALVDAAVSLRDETDTTVKEIRILANGTDMGDAAIREAGERPPGVFERASADLRLTVPRNTWVRGRGTELDISGDLVLRKDPLQKPVLIGSAEVVRGRYTFEHKRFNVRRGRATFDGGTEIDPLLDIEATHAVRDVTILAFLSGRASAPRVRLGSEPGNLSESDVLSYLFLGRPANQLGSAQQQPLESAATALAAGVAANQVGDLLAASLPVDTIDVRMDEQGKPAEVKVGKYVTDRVYVRYGHTLGAESEEEVRLEMRLTPHWSVGTDASTAESAGADVTWSLDY